MESAGVGSCERQAIMLGGKSTIMFSGRRPTMFGLRPIGGQWALLLAVGPQLVQRLVGGLWSQRLIGDPPAVD